MKSASELTDTELIFAYSSAIERANEIYKEKKDLEEEMNRRRKIAKEEHRA